MKSNEKILIASHDAGGAEIVSAWAKKHHDRNLLFSVQGPAIKIFSHKIPHFVNTECKALASMWGSISSLLMGTSWKSDFERTLLKQAKSLGIKTMAFLDHWSNYEIRFKMHEEIILPDEIWTGDEFAYQLACRTFGKDRIKLTENPYFEDIMLRAKSANISAKHENLRILYVCDPAAPMYGYTEFQALTGYLDYVLNKLEQPVEIKLRLHPSEDSSKYDALISDYTKKLVIAKASSADIVEDCLWADNVVGCQTNALVIALKLGKKVFSCIPFDGKACLLPFPEIVKLFQSGE